MKCRGESGVVWLGGPLRSPVFGEHYVHRLKKFVIPNSPGEWFRAVNCIAISLRCWV